MASSILFLFSFFFLSSFLPLGFPSFCPSDDFAWPVSPGRRGCHLRRRHHFFGLGRS
jgi:hypothetical protein